jgi:hypothetical protein
MRPGYFRLNRGVIVLLVVLLLAGCSPAAAVPTATSSAAATSAPVTVATATTAPATIPPSPTLVPPTATTLPPTATAEPVSSVATEPVSATSVLEAEEKEGLPVPEDYNAYTGEQSPFRRGLTATSPSKLVDVLQFYRVELGARQWAELPATVAPTEEQADLMFTNPEEGTLSLKLTRNGEGGTDIALVIRDEVAAKEAGALPPAGKDRIYFANPNEAEVTFTIAGQEVTVPVDAPGMSIADATFIDAAPGKIAFTLTQPGLDPAQDEIEVGEGEVWILVAGPFGAFPIQAY